MAYNSIGRVTFCDVSDSLVIKLTLYFIKDTKTKFGYYMIVEAGHCPEWNPGTHRYLGKRFRGDADDGERNSRL